MRPTSVAARARFGLGELCGIAQRGVDLTGSADVPGPVSALREFSVTVHKQPLHPPLDMALQLGPTTPAAMKVHACAHLSELTPDALSLLGAQLNSSLQLGPDWFGLLHKNVFARGEHTVRWLVLSRYGQALAVLPLVGVRSRLGWKVQSLANYYTAVYAPALHKGVEETALVALLRGVARAFHPLRSLTLTPLPPQAVERLQPAMRAAGMVTQEGVAFANWHQPCITSWPAYLASRSGNLRSTINRSRKRLSAAGGRTEIITEPADVERGMAAYEAVYKNSWKRPEPFPGFFRDLALHAARCGWLRLGVAWLGDQAIAAQFWTVVDGRAEIHKLAYDEAHRDIGAGTVLTAELMQHVIEQDAATYVDYLNGGDDYKRRWMGARGHRHQLVAWPRNTLGGLLVGSARQAYGVVRRLSHWNSRPLLQRPMVAREAADCALILGVDGHGLAEARALAQAGIPVYAIERDLTLPGCRSRFVKRIFAVDDHNGPGLIDHLLALREKLKPHRRVVLFPINDNHTRLIAQHIAQLRAHYVVAWADTPQEVLQLQDKSQLEEVAQERGLNCPRSVVFRQVADASSAESFTFPVIIKPVQPLSSFKTAIARDADDLRRLLRLHAHDLPILGQEYVAGDDESLYFGALLLQRGRVLYGLVGRKIASYPKARGQTTIAEVVEEPDVLRMTQQFFARSHLSGPVSLELKRGPDGTWWVIEPTVGRTDFWVELCTRAGYNQPAMTFEVALGRTPQLPQAIVPSLWYDTERDPFAYLRMCLRHRSLRPKGFRQSFAYAGHLDVRVAAVAVRRYVSRAALRLFGFSTG